MFDKNFLKHLMYFVIFILSYTAIFILFFSTLNYTIPFVLGIIIAIITRPVTGFLKSRLKLSNTFSSLVSTMIIFLLLFIILTIIIANITLEARQLINSAPNLTIMKSYVQNFLLDLKKYYKNIDPSIIEKIQDQIGILVQSGYSLLVSIISKLLYFTITLPILLMIVFITMLSTFFFTKDMENIKIKILAAFSPSGTKRVKLVWNESMHMLGSYLKAYLFILFITFIETLIGFSLFGVKYSLLLSLLCTLFDIIPILGIGTIYFPLIFIYYISGNFFTSAAILGLFLFVSIIRQIIEPKLVSSSLGLHPLAVLAAIFVGLKLYGFIGMIYLIFLLVFYNIFKKVNIL